MQPRRISVLGIGLLGGSLALAVRSRLKGCQIIGYAHRPATVSLAMERGLVDEAFNDPAPAVEGVDLVVLCTPVGQFGQILRRIGPHLSPGAIVTDVGSTKRTVVAEAGAALGGPGAFVGSHPMAGSEKRGLEFARADLFEGALCIVTPDRDTDPEALEKVEGLWRAMGMRTVRLSPEEHDSRLARVSHVPHAVAAALVTMQDDASLEVAGRGFLDTTRIAAGDAQLWRDIFLDNRDNVRKELLRLKHQLDGLLERLEPEAADGLAQWLDAAGEKRKRLEHRESRSALERGM